MANVITGANGADTLAGGRGADSLSGGSGADVFDFNNKAESGVGLARDTITDFTKNSDKLDFSDLGGLTWLDQGSFTGAGTEIRQSNSLSLTVIEIDFDGDMVADVEIALAGVVAVQRSELLI
jgi:Ca2+-binding RTX toxin-like protein